MRESKIEKKVCDYAKSKGWLAYKFKSPSSRGVPDRILLKSGKIVFIEFKVEGKDLNRLQEFIANLIRATGFEVCVVDSIEKGIKLIDKL